MTEAERSPISPSNGALSDDAIVRAWGRYLSGSIRGVAVVDASTETIAAVNDAFARIHGGEPADFEGAPLCDLLTADSFTAISGLLETVRRTGYAAAELEHVRRDGTVVPVHSEVAGDLDDEGNVQTLIFYEDDLTSRQSLEADRLAASRDFEGAFRSGPIGKALVAPDGRFLRVNPALCAITGYSEDELTATTFQNITHPDDLEADLAQIAGLIAGRYPSYEMEKRYFVKGGGFIWVLLSVSLVRGESGEPVHFITQVQDISERKRIEEHLVKMADTDTVTGLWNRRRFEDELTRQVSRCRRYGEQAGLLLVDLDAFKAINDTYGHRSGDSVLKGIGDALTARLRESDGAARIGGDEFAVILRNVTFAQATQIADSLRTEISVRELEVSGARVKITASVGVIHIDSESGNDEEVMVAVDRALYRAKRGGRDRTAVAEPPAPAEPADLAD